MGSVAPRATTFLMNIIKFLFKERIELAIFFTAFLVEIAFGLYLVYVWGSTYVLEQIFQGDMVSHLYLPKTVVDNGAYSSLANLGTVWLPLFHVLIMPLVWIDSLYRTGLAETIVNAFMIGGISLLVYRFMGERKLGIIASVLFMVNLFTIVFGATGTMEPTGTFFLLLSVYFFKLYWEKNDLREFIKCSLALIFGTLARYEVWVVAFLVAFFFTLREVRNKQSYRLAYAQMPFWGVFAWLFWNLAIFRDPLMFIHHPLSTQAQASRVSTIYTGSIWLTTNFTIQMLFTISGPLWVFAILAEITFLARRNMSQAVSIFLLLSPALLLWYIWFTGVLGAAGLLPCTRFWHVAYPGLIVSSLFLVRELINGKISGVKIRSVMTVYILLSYLVLVPFTQTSVVSAISSSPSLGQEKEMRMIAEVVGDGTILSTGLFSHVLSVKGDISPSQIIDDYDGPFYIGAMDTPWKNCSFVFIPKTSPESASIKAINDYYGGKYYVYRYYNDDVWRTLFLEHYHLVLETEGFLLFRNVSLRGAG